MAIVSVTATALGVSHPLAAHELAHACGAEVEWVARLVEIGIIEVHSPAERLEDWRFQSADLHCALAARRLERDFGVELDAAALILDLQAEVRQLKALLSAHGISQGR